MRTGILSSVLVSPWSLAKITWKHVDKDWLVHAFSWGPALSVCSQTGLCFHDLRVAKAPWHSSMHHLCPAFESDQILLSNVRHVLKHLGQSAKLSTSKASGQLLKLVFASDKAFDSAC